MILFTPSGILARLLVIGIPDSLNYASSHYWHNCEPHPSDGWRLSLWHRVKGSQAFHGFIKLSHMCQLSFPSFKEPNKFGLQEWCVMLCLKPFPRVFHGWGPLYSHSQFSAVYFLLNIFTLTQDVQASLSGPFCHQRLFLFSIYLSLRT